MKKKLSFNRANWSGNLTTRTVLAVTLAAGIALTGCYVEVTEDDHDNWGHSTQFIPPALDGHASACQGTNYRDGRSSWFCYEDDRQTWLNSCKSDDCRSISFYVHYMLTEDLGNGRTVHVEAFDNRYFEGSPIAATKISQFETELGEWERGELFLSPGEYYLRAYLTTSEREPVPYPLGDMTLVADEPVGVFGAASSPEVIRVQPSSMGNGIDPVHIYLDKLFKKEGSEPETNAHLRINLSVADDVDIADGREVVIQLHNDEDFAIEPVASFKMASELLLIQGRVGEAEYLSPSLALGEYLVFVFLDANSNGYHDDGELAQVYSRNGEPRFVDIRAKRTATINMQLVENFGEDPSPDDDSNDET